jgi:phage regulator Rha-like protein
MSNLINVKPNATMSSLEMVEFINSQRAPGEAELRHADFLGKVPKVLGEPLNEKFRSIYKDSIGRTLPCYNFPKREACLMAMSYSYDLQAKVFDRMTELEGPPPSFAAALRLAADQQERIEEQQRQLALSDATVAKLEVTLDYSQSFASIKRIESCTGMHFDWRELKSISLRNGDEIKDVFDANYGKVNAYSAQAWMDAYQIDISQYVPKS